MRDVASVVKLVVVVLSLGIDTFTVAVGLGISGIGGRNRLRVGTSFALFEGGMPLVGFFLGQFVNGVVGDIASWVGIAVLCGVGGWMVFESLSGEDESSVNVAGAPALLMTSVSVSLDELAVGFGMGALGLPLGPAVVLIAAQAFALTIVGTALGNRIGETFAERGEVVAGLVLVGLAVVLAVEKVAGR